MPEYSCRLCGYPVSTDPDYADRHGIDWSETGVVCSDCEDDVSDVDDSEEEEEEEEEEDDY